MRRKSPALASATPKAMNVSADRTHAISVRSFAR